MAAPSTIRLFIVDVDGTLLTPDKELTDEAVHAVQRLSSAGVRVALTSGRPPRGMRMLIDPLSLATPLAAFNGGMFVHPDLSVIEERVIESRAAREAADLIRDHHLDVWVYRSTEWYVRDRNAPHVDRERRTVEFEPTVTRDLADLLDRPVKIVGVSDDLDAVARCESDARSLGARVSATRSQPYYLDVTNAAANKGAVVAHLARTLSISRDEIATIGDMPNDVSMFEVSGLSIAMANASAEVQEKAHYVTASNTENGFARAVEELVLPRAPARHDRHTPTSGA